MISISIKQDDKILIIAPHPDDECIGAGGVLSMYPEQCSVLLLTDGAYGGAKVSDDVTQLRQKEFKSEMEYLGISGYHFLNKKDGSLFQSLEFLSDIDLTCYDKIFVTGSEDRHPDHRAAYEATQKRLKEQGKKEVELYQMEVNAPLALPTHYLDMTNAIETKKKLISFHASQTKDRNYEQMVTALAAFRGYQANRDGRYLECYFMSEWDCETNQTSRLEMQLQKYMGFYRLQNKWLLAKNRGYSVGNYLYGIGYRKIAIYGYGDLGKCLYEECLSSQIEVSCVLDRQAFKWKRKDIVTPEELKDGVDLIVITANAAISQVKKSLRDDYRIDTFEQILDEMMRTYSDENSCGDGRR